MASHTCAAPYKYKYKYKYKTEHGESYVRRSRASTSAGRLTRVATGRQSGISRSASPDHPPRPL